MNQPFKRPLVLHYIAVALAPGITFEDSGLMDLLSDARDDSEGRLVEWAHAPQPTTGKVDGLLVDGETQAMLELFESSYVSPELQNAEDTGTRRFHHLVRDGLYYLGGATTSDGPQWSPSSDKALLYDLTNKSEAHFVEGLAAELGGRLFPVEVDAE